MKLLLQTNPSKFMWVLIVTALASCAAPQRYQSITVKDKVTERIDDCVGRYIDNSGVEASLAYDICESIYRPPTRTGGYRE